ncbi:hypothetical protein N9W89_07700 [Hellea sp.]|nr:hypothetical protein [Hellea sp.]
MNIDAIGVRLNLLIGKEIPLPAPAAVMESFESAEIAVSDTDPSGFSLVLKAGRSAKLAGDLPLLKMQSLQAGSRIVITGILGVKIDVLMDGVIQDVDFKPAAEGGSATLTLKGRDLTALMDLEEKQAAFPGMASMDIVLQILASYSRYGIIPDIRPPLASSRDNPVDRTPMQSGTDLAYINELAAEADHIFALLPGPVPLTSRAYWGPPPRLGVPQPALTTNMGPETNISGLSFENTESEAAQVSGNVQDIQTGQTVPVQSTHSRRLPLAARSAMNNARTLRTQILRPQAGQAPGEALSRAQAQSDATTDTLKATGELDLGKYGRVLNTSKLVGLRGAGLDHDGLYYVKDVVHTITPGTWTQAFTLTREGLGTTVPNVRP